MTEVPENFLELIRTAVAEALVPTNQKLDKIERDINGENGASFFNYGMKGAIEKNAAKNTEHHGRIKDLERWRDRIRWSVGGAALGGGLGGGGLVAWITHLLQGG